MRVSACAPAQAMQAVGLYDGWVQRHAGIDLERAHLPASDAEHHAVERSSGRPFRICDGADDGQLG